MQIRQIRNATIKIHYGGKIFLVDPWLAPKDGFGCFARLPESIPFKTPDSQKTFISMPICPLPTTVDEILADVDYYIVTHIHPDHIDMEMDGTVGNMLNKETPVLVQNDEDAQVFVRSGFKDVRILPQSGLSIGEITVTNVPARHGVTIPCGSAMGFMMEGEEKTLYLAGDTVWYEQVEENLRRFQPDVIILNACAAELVDFGRLIMDAEDVAQVITHAPEADIIISHMDNVAHASLSRTSLSEQLDLQNLLSRVKVPADGETLSF